MAKEKFVTLVVNRIELLSMLNDKNVKAFYRPVFEKLELVFKALSGNHKFDNEFGMLAWLDMMFDTYNLGHAKYSMMESTADIYLSDEFFKDMDGTGFSINRGDDGIYYFNFNF